MRRLSAKVPWTLTFMRQWLPHMTTRSVLLLRDYVLRRNRGDCFEGKTLCLKLRSPLMSRVCLREVGSDILTFNEVIGEEVYENVISTLSSCNVVVDLGANIGLASLYFAAHYPNCKLLAVEPNPSSYEILRSNLSQLVSLGRCKTLKAAVWSSERSLSPGCSLELEHYSAFKTKADSVSGSDENTMIGIPMAKILSDSGLQQIDLLKVDIEGAEVELFKGNVDWLTMVRLIAIEFHDNSREACDFDGLMREYGFRIIDHGGHTVLAMRS